MARQQPTHIEAAEFQRGDAGPTLSLDEMPSGMTLTEAPAWQSNGGPSRGHPARSFPFSFEADVPEDSGELARIHLVGALALYAGTPHEAPGTLGGSVQLLQDHETVFRLDLVNGRHYEDANGNEPLKQVPGDGTSIETLGFSQTPTGLMRVDMLSIDVPPEAALPTGFRFRDLGSPASFVIADVFLEYRISKGCPFHASRGVSLSELGSIIRVGDRVRFTKAIGQLEKALGTSQALDEARGEALTFLAIVTAATLEQGGDRRLHLEQLEAAREFDRLETTEQVVEATRRRVSELSRYLFSDHQSPSSHLVDRALAIVERNYAKELTDSNIADQLGLSTSHFRFLFRQATGQPFHKYLIALRLEKARRLLLEEEMPVGDVARSVGFSGLSHFSRAFAQRFQVSPTNVRRSAR